MGLFESLVCPVRRTIVRTSLNWAYFFSPIPVKPKEGLYIASANRVAALTSRDGIL